MLIVTIHTHSHPFLPIHTPFVTIHTQAHAGARKRGARRRTQAHASAPRRGATGHVPRRGAYLHLYINLTYTAHFEIKEKAKRVAVVF